jgi:hypothetical protein
MTWDDDAESSAGEPSAKSRPCAGNHREVYVKVKCKASADDSCENVRFSKIMHNIALWLLLEQETIFSAIIRRAVGQSLSEECSIQANTGARLLRNCEVQAAQV